jgi:hypothetical protein
MNSNKQKKKQIKEKRKQRIEQNRINFLNNGGLSRLKANHANLEHINTYGFLPMYYRSMEFTCRDCGSGEIWTAKQQKFYYEECKGHIDARAVRCNACRNRLKMAKKNNKPICKIWKTLNSIQMRCFLKIYKCLKNRIVNECHFDVMSKMGPAHHESHRGRTVRWACPPI